MAREYPESTSIVWFEYDAGARTLDIAYESGGVYRYLAVSQTVCDQLRAAESKGRFVNEAVKQHYQFRRIA